MISGPLFLCTRVFAAALLAYSAAKAFAGDPMQARFKQGSVQSFLVLKAADGKILALGDIVNVSRGTRVSSRLTFHFRDGSIDDETTVFTQGAVFRVLSDHHVQKGPSFPKPVDIAIDAVKNEVVWRDEHGELKTEQVEIPPDVANGIVPLLIQNLSNAQRELKVAYVTGTPKPRVVKLAIRPDGKESFRVAGTTRKALRYNIHIELGGLAGVVAPVIGKAPADIHVWTMEGEVPTFLRMDGELYHEGPIWTVELAVPAWPASASAN